MITDKALNDILNADEYSLRHYDSEICQAVEELQAYRKAMYDARKQAHLFDSGLGMLMQISMSVKAYYEGGLMMTDSYGFELDANNFTQVGDARFFEIQADKDSVERFIKDLELFEQKRAEEDE